MSYQTTELAEAILQNAFNINRYAWMDANFDTRLIEYHFFTEIYEISLSEEELNKLPEAREYLELFPLDFIEIKVKEATYNFNYAQCRLAFYALLQKQPEKEQLYIRRSAIYRMHNTLMIRDFGGLFDSFGSECEGLTKEAEAFIAAQNELTQ